MKNLKKHLKTSKRQSEWFTMSRDEISKPVKYKFFVKVYIPASEQEDIEFYNSEKEALSVANNLDAMQPENIYEVILVDGNGDESVLRAVSKNVGR